MEITQNVFIGKKRIEIICMIMTTTMKLKKVFFME
jgi:hypothetical protein